MPYKLPAVYIMASKQNGALYVGTTSNLIRRVWEHREGIDAGWSREHGTKMLVWFERHATMERAIHREKSLKKWRRQWKINLIESFNRNWEDLYPGLVGEE